MSDNPNKLAFKGIPAPWSVRTEIHFGAVECRIYGHGNVHLAIVQSNVMNKEVIKANAHMASASPEAVEFIADWIYGIDHGTLNHEETEKLYARAEDILKKAYNF